MKNFSLDLREHAEKIINYEQAKIIAPTKKERKAHRDQKVCYICKRTFSSDDDKYYKIKDHCYYTEKYLGAAHVVCCKNVKYQKKYLLCFIMALLMIIILLLKSWIKNLKPNLSVWVKIQKNILRLVFLLKREGGW